MKLLISLFALTVAPFVTANLQAAGADSQPACAYPIGTKGKFAKVVGNVFDIDGKVGYFAGSNAWFLGHLRNNADIDLSLKQVAATQYKILRVWGFGNVNEIPVDPDHTHSIWYQVLNSTGSYINYGANGLQRLDYVVSAAERYGVKLVLPFVNNWNDFGGINTYSVAFGSNATTFYTHPATQKAYKAYVKTIVNRYKKSTAIFAWELGNEPRCKGCDTSVITNWAKDISRYIKSLDSNHLVTLGDEGWFAPAHLPAGADDSYAYSGVEGVDFIANLKISTLDYGTFHLYPESWGYNYTWGTEWIAQHDAVGKKAGKPIILEEYGAPFPGNHTWVEKPWQDAVYKSQLAADQIWQFGPKGASVDRPVFEDVNTIFFGDAEYEVLGTQHAKRMLKKRVVRKRD